MTPLKGLIIYLIVWLVGGKIEILRDFKYEIEFF
jgi:hypothetical protein